MEVIILAGGLGTRLAPVLPEIPKCLAPVGEQKRPSALTEAVASTVGEQKRPSALTEAVASTVGEQKRSSVLTERPFLGWMLEWLKGYRVDHVVFSVGHLWEQVITYVKSLELPFTCDFAVEETPLGTGGGIRKALELCHEERVYVLNGDTFYPVALSDMPSEAAITLALKPMKDFDRYGAVSVKASDSPTAEENCFSGRYPKNQFSSAIATPSHADALQVTAFHEKCLCAEGLINGGVYALNRSRLDLGSLPEKFSFEKDVLELLADKGKLGGWVSNADFIDIGIPEDYARAQWFIPAWFRCKNASENLLSAKADYLFLDRDGVINRLRPGDYVKTWDEWEWMPGVLQEFPKWATKFERIVLVTNQRGVGRGVMTMDALYGIHERMLSEVAAAGGRMDRILVCTAVSDEDPRRKPNTGMFKEAVEAFPEISAERSIMLGDSDSDERFALNCGMQFVRY